MLRVEKLKAIVIDNRLKGLPHALGASTNKKFNVTKKCFDVMTIIGDDYVGGGNTLEGETQSYCHRQWVKRAATRTWSLH